MELLYNFLEWIMNWCYGICHNYGLAIVLFTLVSKIIMLPITIWTHFNSITMIKIQPEINFLKVKYYGQNDIIGEKQAALFKEKNYHPLLSTVPTILQLILLVGVVGVIRRGIDNPAIDMMMGPINLGLVPSEKGLGLLWSPVVAALSAWVLSFTQNRSNVIQAEQSNINKYGTMALTVGLSLYLGWLVPIGTALYWVASNLMSVIQMYILNWVIKPSKYVDYDRLEESRRALSEIQSSGKTKRSYFSEEAKRERADYKKFFSVINKHLVFYSESNGFYKYFKGYIEYLLENTNLTIHYITSDPNDSIFELEKENPKIRAYYIGENKLITLMMKMDADVVVMTMPDLENYHIKKSYVRKDIEYIFVPHGMGSNNLTQRKHSTAHFSTVFCSGPHQKEEEIAIETLYKLPARNLVEVGYPLLDDMRASYSAGQTGAENPDKKKILIAPSWQSENIVDSCLEDMLNSLMKGNYDIIVRPHPQEVRLKHDYIENLKSKYAGTSVTIQTDFSGNNTVFEADLLVTDWSDIAWEYLFTTYKPVLFINTPMKVMNPDYKDIQVDPVNVTIRDQVGKSLELSQIDKSLEAAEYLLERSDQYRDTIKSMANDFIYNLDGAREIGAKYIIESIKKKISEKGEKNE